MTLIKIPEVVGVIYDYIVISQAMKETVEKK